MVDYRAMSPWAEVIRLHTSLQPLALACSLCQRRFAQQSTFAILVISSSHKHWSCGVACMYAFYVQFYSTEYVPIGMCKLTMEISSFFFFFVPGRAKAATQIVLRFEERVCRNANSRACCRCALPAHARACVSFLFFSFSLA